MAPQPPNEMYLQMMGFYEKPAAESRLQQPPLVHPHQVPVAMPAQPPFATHSYPQGYTTPGGGRLPQVRSETAGSPRSVLSYGSKQEGLSAYTLLPSAAPEQKRRLSGSKTKSTNKAGKRLRMGCMTCRLRKKRCCELRPKCYECSRLGLNCVWPVPGTERKNRNKEARMEDHTINHAEYGKIKVLRGVVEYRING